MPPEVIPAAAAVVATPVADVATVAAVRRVTFAPRLKIRYFDKRLPAARCGPPVWRVRDMSSAPPHVLVSCVAARVRASPDEVDVRPPEVCAPHPSPVPPPLSGDAGVLPPAASKRVRDGRDCSDLPCAPLPTTVDVTALGRYAPLVARSLRDGPPVLRVSPSKRSYVKLGESARGVVSRLLRPLDGPPLAYASVFTVPKSSGTAARLIFDCRPANAIVAPVRDYAPRTPTVGRVGRFLRRASYAATSDYEGWFYQLPIGPRFSRLFYVPSLRGAAAYLPMGFRDASMIATAASAAIAAMPRGRRRRLVVYPTRRHAAALVCSDNTLVAGPDPTTVARRVRKIEARARAVRASFSERFAAPSREVSYYGMRWHLTPPRGRSLLPAVAARSRALLLAFAASRGPVSQARWSAVLGTAGWVSSALSVCASWRTPLVLGLRSSTFSGSVVPSRASRNAARALARVCSSRVAIDAPSLSRACRVPLRVALPLSAAAPSVTPPPLWVYACDAAQPGASAVVLFRPSVRDPPPCLVAWSRVPPDLPICHAELRAMDDAAAHAAAHAPRNAAVVIVSDASTPVASCVRGFSRSTDACARISRIRAAADFLVWTPTDCQPADEASRCVSARAAALAAKNATLSPVCESPLSRAWRVPIMAHS